MDFFKQYLKIMNYSLIGIIFSFASFYLILNLFHFIEVRKEYNADFKNNALVLSIDDTLEEVNKNIPLIKSDNYKTHFDNCIKAFNSDSYNNLKTSNKINIKDVYKLVNDYNNLIVDKCFNDNMYFILNSDIKSIKNNIDLIKLNLNFIYTDTYYLKKDLLSNSNYSFNTILNSKDTVKDSFDEIMNSYNRAAKLLLYLSDLSKMEVGVSND